MKKMNLVIVGCLVAACFTACNSSSDSATKTDSSGTSMKSGDTSTGSSTMSTGDTSSMHNNTGAMSDATTTKTPLNKADSTFVMKAAMGGMMEVQAGTAAQQNAMSDRVKGFGAMMVSDHSKANSELMSIASSKGMTVPADLPADMKKHTDAMAKMKGKAFDTHYMSMMLDDHKKDVAEFEKEAKSASDPDVKAFAAKTLPTLKIHLDSAKAIGRGKM